MKQNIDGENDDETSTKQVKQVSARCRCAKQASINEGKKKKSFVLWEEHGTKKKKKKTFQESFQLSLNFKLKKKKKTFQESFQFSLNFKQSERTLSNVRGKKRG
jgi:hypothetical protein